MPSDGTAAMSGIRVLDLTRVIAGPVCTRYLAALGAEVLRVDPPQRPDLAGREPADTLLGKKSALLDATRPDGLARLHDLVSRADVVVCGYRPGALDRFGLSEDDLIARHPGLVIVVLDAWGHTGPWAGRRGFDSVVQAPSGISQGESRGAGPGALPCQLLDHGTGYLAAAAVLDGVRRRIDEGGTHVRRLSLARTAAWLTSRTITDMPNATPGDDDPTAWLETLDGPSEPVRAVRPPGGLDDVDLRWPRRVTGYGSDQPAW
jgi:crotonobetainyl-CoA:carnitine CoA-transferase CaiB-like acyl-CoA transferase